MPTQAQAPAQPQAPAPATSSGTSPGPRKPRSGPPTWLRVLIPVLLILVWVAAFGAGGKSFGEVNKVAVNDQAEHLPASADATSVLHLQRGFRDGNIVPATLVFSREGAAGAAADAAPLTEADRIALESRLETIQGLHGVVPDSVSPLVLSEDGKAASAFVPLDKSVKISETVKNIRAELKDSGTDGISAYVTGPAGLSADISGAFRGLDGLLLIVALAVVLVILVIVYRSPLLPLIVLGTSVIALTAAISTVVALAKVDILLLSGQTQGILMILVIGAATDYSLLYVSRYREELRLGESKWDATVAALRGSFEPIAASAGTVVAGLLCLLLSDLNSNKALGPVAAIGIVFAFLASLTLLPALMLWAGRVAYWPVRPKFDSERVPGADGSLRAEAGPTAGPAAEPAKGVWPKVAGLVSRKPRVVWVVSLAVLLAAGAGMLQLKADGVPTSDFVIGHSDARDGQTVLGRHFPAGSGAPAVVIAPEGKMTDVVRELTGNDGVESVTVMAKSAPGGTAPVTADGIMAGRPGTTAPVAAVVDGKVMLQATLKDAPESPEAEATVKELRGNFADKGWGSDVLIGGTTAVAIDTNETTIHDRNLIIPVVLVVILLILMLLLRSVLAPVLLVGTVVVSFFAALGVSALVFNKVFNFPGADASVPLFGFVFLVALGIDYNIFLMTRVREESLKLGTRPGILRGLTATGGVITSAGIVLAATFAALGVLPVLFLAQISFIVAFGVLLDTFLVRTLLVPALCYDLGPRIWWPGNLKRNQIDSKL
ncbi:MMPL family transporter [Arthrobacter cavernae]|uniref:MMPL family transporter n=1 Tax=Arthrobacter cavernae TaxID=2817681 RepID=A0A939HJM7_9MICC|nr:MMPL family transporter [Arthrobacter cavernae]MBO1269242.1 MMPL family transporter [Arthrobacter cavernae]